MELKGKNKKEIIEGSKKDKYRILMLHGRQQNVDIFRSRTTGKKKIMDENLTELIFVNAPHLMDTKGDQGEDVYMWWDAELRDPTDSGVYKSIQYLKKFIQEQGPFDGIFGFSQGGIMTSILCSLRAPTIHEVCEERPLWFQFAVIIAASFPKKEQMERFSTSADSFRETLQQKRNQGEILCPTLHVWGKEDPIVNRTWSKELADLFPECIEYEHDGKHFAPVHAEAKQKYQTFITQFTPLATKLKKTQE